MAIVADRCIACERPQAEGSRVGLACETTMAGGRRGDARGSVQGRPRFRLATFAAVFFAFIPLAEPGLADNHQVVVGLGSSGASVTVTRTEEGMYFITSYSKVTSISISPDGRPEGAVADNGNQYSLRLNDEGVWVAEFVAPDPVPLRLGSSSTSVLIQRNEDGSYSIGATPISDGVEVSADDGSRYTLSLSDDGTWTASLIGSQRIVVMLGESGASVTLTRNDAGMYFIVSYSGVRSISIGPDGSPQGAVTEDGSRYNLALSDDGAWVATLEASSSSSSTVVNLGTSGDSVVIVRGDDGQYRIDGVAIQDGATRRAGNGNTYRLTLGADSVWRAAYVADSQTVALGSSGTQVTLTKAEDGTWSDDRGMRILSGTTLRAGEREYVVTLTNGVWSVEFRGTETPVAGTDLIATSTEDGSGYVVGGVALGPTGAGSVTVDGASYHIWTVDGALHGARYQALEIDRETYYWTGDLGSDAVLTVDDPDTVANETRTGLTIADDAYSLGELLATGRSSASGDTFVDEARAEIEGHGARIKVLRGILDSAALAPNLAAAWTDIQGAIDSVFGPGKVSLGSVPAEHRIEEEIDDLVLALSSAAEFENATQARGVFDGVLTGSGRTAAEVFGATKSESTLSFGVTGSTSYGALLKRERANALSELTYTHDASPRDATPMSGELGAFAYSTMPETPRTRHVADSGNAFYEGATAAVSGDGKHYAGDIEVRVRFATNEVDALVKNLTEDGRPWNWIYGDVERIVLPTATLAGDGEFSTPAAAQAVISFESQVATTRPETVDGTFGGRLLGEGVEAGNEMVGTWSVGNVGSSSQSQRLWAGFGATRGEAVQRPQLPIDDGRSSPAVETGPATTVDSGTLTIAATRYGFSSDGSYGALSGSEARRTYEIDLGALYSGRGQRYTLDGARHVAEARELIAKARSDLEALLRVDGTESNQAQRWEDVKSAVRTRLFGAVPQKIDATYAPGRGQRFLEDVDSVLAALESPEQLAAALKAGDEGIFTDRARQPTVPDAATDIWNERESEVQAWLESTNYTRFGVWGVRTKQNATSATSWQARESEAFAYSQLPPTIVPNEDVPYYAPGGSATYAGSTVAWVGPLIYKGAVEVQVSWNAAGSGVGGQLTMAIAGLEDVATGDLLTYDADGAGPGSPIEVNGLVFGGVAITRSADSHLVFEGTAFPGTPGMGVSLATAGIGSPPQALDPVAELSGIFVGRTSDGPRGVIGRWSVQDNGLAQAPVSGTYVPGPEIRGAFGAEVP